MGNLQCLHLRLPRPLLPVPIRAWARALGNRRFKLGLRQAHVAEFGPRVGRFRIKFGRSNKGNFGLLKALVGLEIQALAVHRLGGRRGFDAGLWRSASDETSASDEAWAPDEAWAQAGAVVSRNAASAALTKITPRTCKRLRSTA